MADRLNTIERATFIAQGIATMGVDPKWDAAVTNYITWETRSRVQEEFGPIARRREDDNSLSRDLERKLGKGWRDHPEGRAHVERIYKAGLKDERELLKRFYEPFWEAQRHLVTTPAPSLAAAAFKMLVIQTEDVWLDGTFEGDCVEIIDADLARFAMPLAA